MTRLRVLLLLILSVGVVHAPAVHSALPVVDRHQLNCGDTFPCPPEIQRRVDFWIMVFRKWGTDQVIFHDTRYPERVYSVLKTKGTCRRRKGSRDVERERTRVRETLRRTAKKLTQKSPKYTATEREFLSLFPTKTPRALRRAVENVRCQQGNRDRFFQALQRYGLYKDHILNVLREADLSEDILYLPFVESAFNPRAYSSAGAAGMWQIMPATGRTLGLQLNATIDERFDPESATWAAARYLRNSTDSLTALAREIDPDIDPSRINPFVITSYNYGVSGMRRAMRKHGPDYITVLNKYRSASFRTAVRNFYSSFLAARYVAQNFDKYFGDIRTRDDHARSVVVLERPTSARRISKVFNVSIDRLKTLNPALTRYVWNGTRLIPDGFQLRLPYRADNWKSQVAGLNRLKAEKPHLSGTRYRVKRGDTACGIARAFKVRCRDLIRVNGLNRRALIRIGQRLEIPAAPGGVAAVQKVRAKSVRERTGWAVAKVDLGQKKSIPDVAPPPEEPEPAAPAADIIAAAAPEAPLPVAEHSGVIKQLIDTIDVKIAARVVGGVHRYSIRVEPEETIGHYADWLGIGGSAPIRRMNNIKRHHRLRVGTRIALPVKTVDDAVIFERKRLEYHRTLVDEFHQHYEVVGMEPYIVKRGDSIWKIAHANELPHWVVTRLNPDKLSPNVGDRVMLPLTRARRPSKEPLATGG